MIAFMNLYRQGWYHSAGKPGTLDVHPGDLYPTRELAVADIDHDAPFVATVPINIPDGVITTEYPSWSAKRKMVETRAEWRDRRPDTVQLKAYAADVLPTKPHFDGVEWEPETPGSLPITHGHNARFDAIFEAEEAALRGEQR